MHRCNVKTKLLILALLVLALPLVSDAGSRQMEHDTVTVDAGDADEVDVVLEFDAGSLAIAPKAMAEVAIFHIDFDPRRHDHDVDYRVRGRTGRLRAESLHRRGRDVDTELNQWDVVLSEQYPMDLTLDIGACAADIDLGGLSLHDVEMDVGAASGKVTFSKRNPVRMREFSVDAGATSLSLHSLGNANFDFLDFSGGAGSFELDLRGDYHGESLVTVEIGLGAADVVLPRHVPVRVETGGSNWLSAIDIHGDCLEEVGDGLYESSDFEDAVDRIVIKIDVGLGAVDIYRK